MNWQAPLFAAASVALASPIAGAPRQINTGTNVSGRETASPVATTGEYIRGPETTEVMPSDAAIALARATANCVIGKKPADAQLALNATDWRSFILATQKLAPAMSHCVGKVADVGVSQAELGFSAPTYYGVLSEAWLIRNGMEALEPVAYSVETPSFAWLGRGASDNVILRLADCLAHKEPQRVEALVRSKPLSDQEAAEFASIKPILHACLDSNVTLSATKSKLRLALATAIYRRSTNISVQQVEALR